MRKNQSPLANKEELSRAIASATTCGQILKKMGLRAAGGNFKQLKKWAELHELKLPDGNKTNDTTAARLATTVPDDMVYCENSTYTNRHSIKKRLRKIWDDWSCASCGIGEEWNGKPLTLQLEHKNGVWNDNRLENLELLCPNCHSQTDTFAGRKRQ